MRLNLAFLGFGNVGRSVARLMIDQSPALRRDYGIEWALTGIATRRSGWVADARGIDGESALVGPGWNAGAEKHPDAATWLAAAKADVMFEMSSLDTSAGEPALSNMCVALERGIHVVTANKGPIVFGYQKLRDLAASHNVSLRFESTVMDGAPIFSLFRQSLPLVRIERFEGILNSTSNMIIGEIEQGSTMVDAIARAQALGLAETDPAADVDGFDAAVKVAALVIVLMGTPIELAKIERQGIRDLNAADIRAARSAGTPYKLLCRAWRTEEGIHATVGPEKVDASSPFAQVNGTSSIVHFSTNMLPGLSIVEHEPTPLTTAYGMLVDFIDITRSMARS
jgi:homoserine dehydrogenase